MSVLVINCGSSSVKYQLVHPDTGNRISNGQIERIGDGGVADHDDALRLVAVEIQGALDNAGAALDAVGHRVVHGGNLYSDPVLVTADVLAAIDELSVLAPLHNPVNAQGIKAAQAAFPEVAQVAVFDTAFHATIPAANRTYAVPRAWEQEYGVRSYGFHGTSHGYVSRVAGEWLEAERGIDPSQSRVVVLHLGNGASACAVHGGRSIETSMGMTPLPGLVMGTRSGDVDPAVFGHLSRVAGMTIEQVETGLNRDSGMLGLCGDSDMRAVEERAKGGDAEAALALDVYVHRICSTVGSYVGSLGGLDALVFTAGIGENSVGVRRRVVEGLGAFGLELDRAANEKLDGTSVSDLSSATSRAAVVVVRTDEEGEIARQALAVVRA